MTPLQSVERAKKILANAEARLEADRANRTIKCCCGKFHKVKDFTLIVTHWYVQPYSCTGGDYWKEGEWNIVGPCGVNNRLLFNDSDVDWKERDKCGIGPKPTFKQKFHRGLWKAVLEEHTHSNPRPNNINYYPDINRVKFELPAKVKS